MCDANRLESWLCQILTQRGQTLATAESCSGGLIAHRLTNVPGSSTYFQGGIVSYSNAAKEQLVGVSRAALEAHGAVSAAVAREMAGGARRRFAADWGVGVTGIAGPSGGTLEKPVGLVYIAVDGPAGTRVVRRVFGGDRVGIKEQTADAALELLKEQLE